VIAPLRHPLLVARELGSLDLLSGGRLVVLPTVSWLAEEYAALGVPFRCRGDLLDEHLAAWAVLWRDAPACYDGRHYAFREAYFESISFRNAGPELWLGEAGMHRRTTERIVRYGAGFSPLGRPAPAEMQRLRDAMRAAGRDILPASNSSAARARCSPASGARPASPGAGGDPAADRGGLHDLLHQAVAVHRTTRTTWGGCAGRSSAESAAWMLRSGPSEAG
jgi:alkanesulfonate monooxygenase SsuD/methylene tetrahydromethanopterin reductase-like flavin-dependent oxidoreductase (luciferase family)